VTFILKQFFLAKVTLIMKRKEYQFGRNKWVLPFVGQNSSLILMKLKLSFYKYHKRKPFFLCPIPIIYAYKCGWILGWGPYQVPHRWTIIKNNWINQIHTPYCTLYTLDYNYLLPFTNNHLFAATAHTSQPQLESTTLTIHIHSIQYPLIKIVQSIVKAKLNLKKTI